MGQIPLHSRPPYLVSLHYHPEAEEELSGWNVRRYPPTDLREWLYDEIEYYCGTEARDPEKIEELLNTIQTARKYDRTCIGHSSTETIVTHLYVCELLVKTLLLFFGYSYDSHHGYTTSGLKDILEKDSASVLDLKLLGIKSGGLHNNLHDLFFTEPLTQDFPTLEEYLLLCPELIKECQNILHKPSHVYQGSEDFSLVEKDSSKYLHSITIEDRLVVLQGHRSSTKEEDFPELINYQDRFQERALEDKSDQLISMTSDVEGDIFALGFGQSQLSKQREIEIRFYIVYLLGSLGRYHVNTWQKLRTKEIAPYLLIKRFLDYNHLLFPFIVLRYITGRSYTFAHIARFS